MASNHAFARPLTRRGKNATLGKTASFWCTMAQLWPLESPGIPQIGGVLFKFPSGLQKTLQWEYSRPVVDTLKVSKHLTACLLDELMREDKADDINRTNWVSLTAAIQKMVGDWNAKMRAALVAQHSTLDLSPATNPTQ